MVPETHLRNARDSSSSDGTAAQHGPRKPTVQDMYNAWRSLEQQVNEMPRLPMAFKVESRFCHACRVLKRRCECFDYSDLEPVFSETNTALRAAALHYNGAPRSDAATRTATTTITTQQHTSDNMLLRHDRRRSTPSRARAHHHQTVSPPQQHVNQENFDFNVVVVSPPPSPSRATFERRTVVIAKERVGGGVRRWCCQFGAAEGGPVCTREDDKMETIRRHHGREHGRLRYHKRPVVHMTCSRCGHSTGDQGTTPATCSRCHADDAIWLGEVTAVIEVQVPAVTGDESLEEEDAAAQPGPSPATPTMSHLQPAYNAAAAGFLSTASAPQTGSFAPPTPSPLTPMTPLTPVTPSMAAAAPSVASYSPLFSFAPASDMDFKTDMTSLFPGPYEAAGSVPHSTGGPAGSYNTAASGLPSSFSANTFAAPALFPDFSGTYEYSYNNAALAPPPASMASAMTMGMGSPVEQLQQLQQLQQQQQQQQQSYMAMDDMQLMAMDTTGYY